MGDADRIAALSGRACQPVVAGIAVELQDPVEAVYERLGVLSAAIGGVEVDHDEPCRAIGPSDNGECGSVPPQPRSSRASAQM